MIRGARTGLARACGVVLALLALAAPAQAAPEAPRPAGRHAAELCVATGESPMNCGPAEALWSGRGRLRLRISDLEYRLQLHSSQLDVVLMHGSMQIDEFFAPYEGRVQPGETLRFEDRDKRTRYEVRFGERRGAAR